MILDGEWIPGQWSWGRARRRIWRGSSSLWPLAAPPAGSCRVSASAPPWPSRRRMRWWWSEPSTRRACRGVKEYRPFFYFEGMMIDEDDPSRLETTDRDFVEDWETCKEKTITHCKWLWGSLLSSRHQYFMKFANPQTIFFKICGFMTFTRPAGKKYTQPVFIT